MPAAGSQPGAAYPFAAKALHPAHLAPRVAGGGKEYPSYSCRFLSAAPTADRWWSVRLGTTASFPSLTVTLSALSASGLCPLLPPLPPPPPAVGGLLSPLLPSLSRCPFPRACSHRDLPGPWPRQDSHALPSTGACTGRAINNPGPCPALCFPVSVPSLLPSLPHDGVGGLLSHPCLVPLAPF